MTRKTAIKLVLAMPVAHYAAESKKREEMTAILSGESLSSVMFRPVHFTLSKEGISGITLRRDKEEITISFDEIFDALKDTSK